MKSISIHLTDTCNNSCNFCVVNSHQGSTEKVNRKVVNRFIEAHADKGYDSVNIHGGEPTLVPEFMDILEKIQQLGYPYVSLQTNGRLLKDMDYARQLTDRGVKLFVISLHGKNAAQHDWFTQVEGSFDEAVAGIKNVKTLGQKVRTNTVICNQNYRDLPQIVDLSLSLGTDHINISSIHTTGRSYENFDLVVPKVTQTTPIVKSVVDSLVADDRVVTLEGFPYCVLGDHHKYMIDWDANNFKLLYRTTVLDNYASFMENQTKKKGDCCHQCPMKTRCGGVYKEYIQFYGWDEFSAMKPLAN